MYTLRGVYINPTSDPTSLPVCVCARACVCASVQRASQCQMNAFECVCVRAEHKMRHSFSAHSPPFTVCLCASVCLCMCVCIYRVRIVYAIWVRATRCKVFAFACVLQVFLSCEQCTFNRSASHSITKTNHRKKNEKRKKEKSKTEM